MHFSNNQLTGPALPGVWMLPGALHNLALLDVSGNRGLTGTLPVDFSFWPSITRLDLDNTSVHGTVPQQWCTDGFGATSLQQV